MISCKRATELISKSMEQPLSVKENLALKVHLFICEFCEQFLKQVELLRKSMHHEAKDAEEPRESADQRHLPEDVKKRLLGRIAERDSKRSQ